MDVQTHILGPCEVPRHKHNAVQTDDTPEDEAARDSIYSVLDALPWSLWPPPSIVTVIP